MTTELLSLYCPSCERDQLAEVPPCPDGHGDQCPDRACVACGTALLFDSLLLECVPSARRVRRAGRGRTVRHAARAC